MAKKKQPEDYGRQLADSFDRWQQLYLYGGQDPGWADGVNLNLVRNHIIYYKSQIRETMAPDAYPEIYYRATPPQVDSDYIAGKTEIRESAQASLKQYLADPDYQFLCERADLLPPKDEKKLCVRNVIGYAAGLERAIREDDLVTMRRHRNPEGYLPAFRSCAEKVRDLKPEDNEQIALLFSDNGLDEQDPEDEEWEV